MSGILFILKRAVCIIISIAVIAFTLDFIPIKFCLKDTENLDYIFISQAKAGVKDWAATSDINYTYDLGDEDALEGYYIEGKDPNKELNEKEFDYVFMEWQNDRPNRFVIYYDERIAAENNSGKSEYNIVSKGWDILAPIQRLSFRKYYAPKNYLTIYDFNWINIIKDLFI